jgi:CheY-like chemotaxis protein
MATTILVVEDDSLNRDLVCKVLRQAGHGVFEASDGAQALELLCARCFDLIITDYLMPKVDGVELVKQVHLLQPNMPQDQNAARDRLQKGPRKRECQDSAGLTSTTGKSCVALFRF